MVTKTKASIVGATIAAIIIAGGTYWGVSVSAAPEPKPNPVTTFQGVAAPAGIPKLRFAQDNPTKEDAIKTIAKFHETFNSQVGFGNDVQFEKGSLNFEGAWTSILSRDEMNPADY